MERPSKFSRILLVALYLLPIAVPLALAACETKTRQRVNYTVGSDGKQVPYLEQYSEEECCF